MRIAVLMGGPSPEHDVSLRSGENVVRHLAELGYEIIPTVISRSGGWPIDPEDLKQQIDLAFIAMHGAYGEDGQIQRILEDYGIPYTGSDVLSSALGMNKIASSLIFQAHELTIPEYMVVNKRDQINSEHFDFSNPLLVKPAYSGSSLGVSIVRRADDLLGAVERALAFGKDVLIQEYKGGQEVTCAVIEDSNGDLVALHPIEILPKANNLFDYAAKYTPGATDKIPARLPDYKINLIKEITKTAHGSVGARGFSRTDMIVSPDDRVYVLEINTIPGMTEQSLLPKAAEFSGYKFGEVLEKVIGAAQGRYSLI